MDIVTYALLLKKIKGVATGVSGARYNGDTREVIFTCNDGTELSIPIPNGLTSAQIEMINHMTLEGDVDTGFYIAVDGERVGSKTCNFKTTVTVGALPSGTVLDGVDPADVLEQILISKLPPVIGFVSSLLESGTYEIGENKDIELSIKVTKQSYDVEKVEITSTPSLPEFTKNLTSAPWEYSGEMSINNTQTVTVKATDVEGLTSTKSIKYNFVYPMYASYVDAGVIDITEADVISGQKVIKPKGAITLAYTSNDILLRPVFAYPAEYGELKKITDVLNQIELITNYTKYDVQIECLDGNVIDYYAYASNTEAILDNFEIKFSW